MPPRVVLAAVAIVLVTNGCAFVAWIAHGAQLVPALGIAVVVLFLGLAVLHRSGLPVAPWFVLAVTVGVQMAGLASPPLTSDDAYRYVWDGRVQAAGVDPYRYVPEDPALHRLRDPLLFPDGEHTRINRPDVPTIYPPAAQAWFTAIAWATPARFGTLGVQAAAMLAVVTTTWILATRTPGSPLGALTYGACPAVVLEAANGAHVDAVSALLIVLVIDAGVRRRHWLAGVWLGLAAAVKLVPLLLLPVFGHRRTRPTVIAAILTFTLSYLPHVVVVGGLVAGFLPGYAQQEGYSGRSRFALLLFLPPAIRLAAAALLAVGLVVLALYRARRDPLAVTCCWLYGSAILLATPVYAWYALPLAVLAIVAARWEWLAVWAASYAAFVGWAHIGVQATAYGTAAAIVAAALVLRRRRSRLPGLDPGRPVNAEAWNQGRSPSISAGPRNSEPPARHTRSVSRP